MQNALQANKQSSCFKKWLMISATSSLLITGTALATEGLDWTGFHLAGGVGYGMMNHNSYVTEAAVPVTSMLISGGKGWLGRVGVGYNVEFTPCFVLGAFADYDFMAINGLHDFPGVVGNEKQNRAWYVGGLAGYTFTPLTLAFIDAGYTNAHLNKVNYNVADTTNDSTGLTLSGHSYNGWFLGIGMETLLATCKSSSLFLRTEYRYSGYGSASVSLSDTIALDIVDAAERSRLSAQTVTTSIIWSFLRSPGC